MTQPNLFDLIEKDTLTEALSKGGNLNDIFAHATEAQLRKDALSRKLGPFLVVIGVTLGIFNLVGWLAAPVAVVSLALALFTLITWQTFGVILGITLLTYCVRRFITTKIDAAVAPYVSRFFELREQGR